MSLYRIKVFLRRAPGIIAGALASSVLLTGCIVRKPVTGPTVAPLWKAKVGASERPRIVGDILYMMGQIDDGENSVYAFDAATGQQLWKTDFAVVELVAVKNNQAFVRDKEDFIHRLDARTGSEQQKSKMTADYTAFLWTDAAFYGVTAKNELVALGADGKPVWRAQTPYTNVYGNPMLDKSLVYLFGQYYVNAHAGENGIPYVNNAPPPHYIITAYDAGTGALRWQRETQPGDRMSAPLVANGVIYFIEESEIKNAPGDNPNGSQIKVEYTLHAFDVAAGKDVWTVPSTGYLANMGGPRFIDGDTLLFAEGISSSAERYRGVNRKTGAVLWEMQPEIQSRLILAYADGILYATGRRDHALLDEKGNTSPDSWLSAIDSQTGKQLWHSDVQDLCEFTAPVIANGLVYVASTPFYWNGERQGGAFALYAFRASRDGK